MGFANQHPIMNNHPLPEFRFYYFTSAYETTVAFYRDILEWEVIRSWSRPDDKRTLFRSPNGSGIIEIEEGDEKPLLGGGLYIEVENVDDWYEQATKKEINIITALSNTTYGHRSFKFADPNGMEIVLYITRPS